MLQGQKHLNLDLPLMRLTMLSVANTVPILHEVDLVELHHNSVEAAKVLHKVGVASERAFSFQFLVGESLSAQSLKGAVILEVVAFKTVKRTIYNTRSQKL